MDLQEQQDKAYAPRLFKVLLLLHPYSSVRPLRSNTLNLLSVPRTLFKTRGEQASEAAAPELWTTLPAKSQSAGSVVSFKNLFSQALVYQVYILLNYCALWLLF